MPSNRFLLERQIYALIEKLHQGEISRESARELLWSTIETIANDSEADEKTRNHTRTAHHGDQGTSAQMPPVGPARPLPSAYGNAGDPDIARYLSNENQWTCRTKYLPTQDPNDLCFEVIVEFRTEECGQEVTSIAKMATQRWNGKLRADDRNLVCDDDAKILFAIPSANDASLGQVYQSNRALVFLVRDQYPFENLIAHLPWPPPKRLLDLWSEDFDKLEAWFGEVQIPLDGLDWEALWVTREGRLNLPTWPIYALRSMGLGPPSRNLSNLRDEILSAAGVTKALPFDCQPPPATKARDDGPQTGKHADGGPKEIPGSVPKKARQRRSHKRLQTIVAATAVISICAIMVVLVTRWGKQGDLAGNANDVLNAPQVSAFTDAEPKELGRSSQPSATVQIDAYMGAPSEFDASLNSSTAGPSSSSHIVLQPDATMGPDPNSMPSSELLVEPEALATAMPQVDADFFQDIMAAEVLPIPLAESSMPLGDGKASEDTTDNGPMKHSMARPELRDSRGDLPTATFHSNAEEQVLNTQEAQSVNERAGNESLAGRAPLQTTPMTVPAIPLRVQIEPQQHQWEFVFSRLLTEVRPHQTLSLYQPPESLFQEISIDGLAGTHSHSLLQANHSSGNQRTVYWSWLLPVDEAVGRSQRGLIEFALEEYGAQERVRVRLDVQVGKTVEYSSASVATWDGGRSWHAISLDKIRETRARLTDQVLHIDHAIARAKTTYELASSTDERALLRAHRKTLEANEQLLETLDSRLSELETLVALLEMHAAFTLVIQADKPLAHTGAAEAAGNDAPRILFQSTLAPTTDPLR